jgi:hypothetical protein
MVFGTVSLPADAEAGELLCVNATLSATPETVKTVSLPDWARGFRLTPSDDVRFAVGEDPAALATHAAGDNSLAVVDFSIGNVAAADLQEVRALPARTGRTLRLASAEASATVLIELF